MAPKFIANAERGRRLRHPHQSLRVLFREQGCFRAILSLSGSVRLELPRCFSAPATADNLMSRYWASKSSPACFSFFCSLIADPIQNVGNRQTSGPNMATQKKRSQFRGWVRRRPGTAFHEVGSNSVIAVMNAIGDAHRGDGFNNISLQSNPHLTLTRAVR